MRFLLTHVAKVQLAFFNSQAIYSASKAMKNNRIHHMVENISMATVEQGLSMLPLDVPKT